ncbi:unnamed protein product [Meloidogyne enterolobii]|uniref:Uncharacterized protein n=1 Tax=Meloidogyne enterolobii TaxID=390850 RepID=A0ACB0YV72_MELEN
MNMRLVNFMFLLLYLNFSINLIFSNPLKSQGQLQNLQRFQMLILMLNITFSDIPLAPNQLISVFRQITSKILFTHLTFTPQIRSNTFIHRIP